MVAEDLGLKLGSKLQVLWKDVADQAEKDIEALEKSLVVQQGIRDYARSREQEAALAFDSEGVIV